MTETPEFSGCPEIFIREDYTSLTASEVSNELMWAVSELVDRMQECHLAEFLLSTAQTAAETS